MASKLAEYLQPHTPYGHRWTVFDQNLIKKVLEDHWMPGRLSELLPESSTPLLRELTERMHGKKPAVSLIIRQTVETIWHLAESGHVILVGRAANVITAKLRNVFHVRLVGSPENRIERLEEVYDFDRAEAIKYMKTQDSAKKAYLRDYFGENIENPELYHLIVNTDRISYDEAAKLIGDAVIHAFKLAPVPRSPVSFKL